jgi:hypothetical protein
LAVVHYYHCPGAGKLPFLHNAVCVLTRIVDVGCQQLPNDTAHGLNYQDDLQLYVLGGVFLVSSFVWYFLFRFKLSVYVLSFPWLFFGIAFFLIAIPSLSPSLASSHTLISDFATWCYAVSSSAAFVFFGLNFGEEAVSFFFQSFDLGMSD